MDVRVTQDPLHQIRTDVLIIPHAEGTAFSAEIGGANADVISTAIEAGDFKGEYAETAIFYTKGMGARKVMLAGLGDPAKLTYRKLRKWAGTVARTARSSGAKTVAFSLPAVNGLEAGKIAQFLVEGSLHGLYRFETYKSDQSPKPQVESLTLAGGREVEAGAEVGRILGEATNLSRSLNWMPGNKLTAAALAERAEQVAREAGLEIAVFDKKGCAELGLGLLLAVNQGSVHEPRFIVMKYKGGGGKGPWLGLIGKGLTFDAGGISLKPSDNMWDMKYDMSGAGSVLGAMQAIAKAKLPCDVMGIIAATDNVPDGGAYKPGDVIVGLSGKSVEVRSTDAEGRLVLADALAYAVKEGCEKLITVATLTGAVQIALGPVRMGVVANNDDWEHEVYQALEEAGEPGWRLPHDEEYYDFFKSPIADMSNSGTARAAGTVVGGLFLMKHVGNTPCVHLDIASQAWANSGSSFEEAGATGVAVKALVKVAERWHR
ncbi:MAG: leucyl aminopeptidase family protein [Mycobacterium leprae]